LSVSEVGEDPYAEHDDLTARQKDILEKAVAGYIKEFQPISSFYIIENFNPGLSSATIRSIFSELDQKGYLYSPHRSSGRIPTEKGYRFYVKNLSEGRCLLEDDRKFIQSEYLKRDFRAEDVLEVSCRILSTLTDYAGVVLGPEPESAVLKHIELIDLGEDEVLVVLVTRAGLVYNKRIFLENRIPTDSLHKISRYLNTILKGNDLLEVKKQLNSSDIGKNTEFYNFISMIAVTISSSFDLVSGNVEFYKYGLDNLFVQMAGIEGERIRELGNLFDTDDYLKGIFRAAAGLEDVVVSIDGDRERKLSGLSIVSSSYKMGERHIGSIGVVGPNRMDYSRVISIVEYMSLLVSNMMTRISR
jgi:heat-inducible transcriptional repressor